MPEFEPPAFLSSAFFAIAEVACPSLIRSLQGWCSGESTCLPPMWPRLHSHIQCHIWVELFGSLLCTKRFSLGTLVSPLLKNQHLTSFALLVNFTL